MKKALLLAFVAALTLAAPVVTRAQFCASPTKSVTSIGTTAGSVPATALAGRRVIVVCNSAENSGSAIVKCREDGTVPVLGTAAVGDVLAKGQCVPYSIGSGTVVQCIASAPATTVAATECKGDGFVPPVPTAAGGGTASVSGTVAVSNLPALGIAAKSASLPVVQASDGVIETAVGAPSTPIALSVTSGANATATLTGGVRYRVVNTSGVYAFCKLGGTATLETDVPYAPDVEYFQTFGNTGDGSLIMNCVLRSSTTGKILFSAMTPKL